MRILKTDTSHRTATFVVLEPDVEDRNGDVISADEIVKTAHEFVRNIAAKFVNIDHKAGTVVESVEFVESFVLPEDLTIAGSVIKSGSWLVGFRFISEEVWQQVLDGEISGVSMEGYGCVD